MLTSISAAEDIIFVDYVDNLNGHYINTGIRIEDYDTISSYLKFEFLPSSEPCYLLGSYDRASDIGFYIDWTLNQQTSLPEGRIKYGD